MPNDNCLGQNYKLCPELKKIADKRKNKKFDTLDNFIDDLLSRTKCSGCSKFPAGIKIITLNKNYNLREYLKKYIQLKN